jgi:hypothetical protein
MLLLLLLVVVLGECLLLVNPTDPSTTTTTTVHADTAACISTSLGGKGNRHAWAVVLQVLSEGHGVCSGCEMLGGGWWGYYRWWCCSSTANKATNTANTHSCEGVCGGRRHVDRSTLLLLLLLLLLLGSEVVGGGGSSGGMGVVQRRPVLRRCRG